MKIKIVVGFFIVAMLQSHIVLASQPGGLIFLESCPGDDISKIDKPQNESLTGAIVTSIVTGIVKVGVAKIGKGLSAAAEEKKVDELHSGGYFYKWVHADISDNEALAITPNVRCLVFASRSTGKPTKTKIDDLVRGYVPQTLAQNKAGSLYLNGYTNDAGKVSQGILELKKQLVLLDFDDVETPGLTAVFDIQYSNQGTEFRFVPRYAYLDHSLRKGGKDDYLRDFTFTIGLTIPGVDKYKPVTTLKMERLGVDRAWTQDSSKTTGLLSGHWVPMPALNTQVENMIKQSHSLTSEVSTNKNTYLLAATAAKSLGIGDEKISHPTIDGRKITFIESAGGCPAGEELKTRVRVAHGELATEASKKPQSLKKVNMWTNVLTYLNSCASHDKAYQKSLKLKETLSDRENTGAFDLVIDLKEYRDRPVAKFFGEVFSDAEVIKGVSSAVASELDSATKKAEKVTALTAYEDARLKAEEAIITHDSSEAKDKASNFLKMEYAKRASNRTASNAGLAWPYPESGDWFN